MAVGNVGNIEGVETRASLGSLLPQQALCLASWVQIYRYGAGVYGTRQLWRLSANVAVLSQGIYEALVTIRVGLIVGIIAMIAPQLPLKPRERK